MHILAAVAALILLSILSFPLIARRCIRVDPTAPRDWRERVLLRYQNHGATFPWIFAWFKLRLDPMFAELPLLIAPISKLESVLDIGCGFGVAGCALLEWRPEVKIFGLDPRADRARAAKAAFGIRGDAAVGRAPEIELPGQPNVFDAALMLDMVHYLTDPQFDQTLGALRRKLGPNGYVILRAIVPPIGGGSWAWKFAAVRRKITREFACHRAAEQLRSMLATAGFSVEKTEMSGNNPELLWIVAKSNGRL